MKQDVAKCFDCFVQVLTDYGQKKAILSGLGKPLIGLYSHRFSLAAKEFMKRYESEMLL
jgi:hypothetical protein